MNGDGPGAPSPWVERWIANLPEGGCGLDVACGRGRHVQRLRRAGLRVVAVDRDAAVLRAIPDGRDVLRVRADLEADPWPFATGAFAVVVVTNYLWRPLLPTIVDAVAEGGMLVYETFLRGHERFGRPQRPEFLLEPGELLRVASPVLEVLGFEEGPDGDPPTAMRQRLCARRPRRGGVGRGSGSSADWGSR